MCMSEHEANNSLETPTVKTTTRQQQQEQEVENNCRKEGCVECTEGECSGCEEGMFLKDGECWDCDWKCKKCSAEEECEECRDGFVLNKEDSRCYQCKVRHCRKCDGEEGVDECEECKEGYELVEGKCSETRKKMASAAGDMTFSEFKTKYGKQYKDAEEESRREYIFNSNIEAIETLR